MPHLPSRAAAAPRRLPGIALLAAFAVAAAMPAAAQGTTARMPAGLAPAPVDQGATGQGTTVQVSPTPLAPAPLAPAPLAAMPQPTTPVAPAAAPRPALAMQRRTLSFETGAGQLVTLQGPAANVFVADPKVAEVRPGSATTLFIFGVGPGHTTVAALDDTGAAVAQYDVTVRPSVFLSGQVEAAIARVVPGSHVLVTPQPKGLLVSGRIGTPEDAARVLAVAKSFLPDGQTVEDQLALSAATQVTLRCRAPSPASSASTGRRWVRSAASARCRRCPSPPTPPRPSPASPSAARASASTA